MGQVIVIYHYETDGYWAESPDVPGFYAAGATLAETQEQVRSGLGFHVGEDVTYVEQFPDAASVVSSIEADVPATWFVSAGVVVGQAISTGAGQLARRLLPTPPGPMKVPHAG